MHGDPGSAEWVAQRHASLAAAVEAKLRAQGFGSAELRTERFLNLRYEGTDTAIMIPEGEVRYI